MAMRSHHITLSGPASEAVEAQVKLGRYKDFSAAIQEAVWNYFLGMPSPFKEYGVTPDEVARCASKEIRAIEADRKAGKLKPWKA